MRRTVAVTLAAVVGWGLLTMGSARADVVAPSLAISVSATPAAYGQQVTFAGRLTAADAGVPGATVVLERLDPSGTWAAIATGITSADGTVDFSIAADATAAWRLHHPADGVAAEAVSAVADVGVRPALAATWTRTAVRVNRTATVRGTVAPAAGGLRLERLDRGTWRRVTAVPVGVDGTFRAGVRPAAAGFGSYRLVRPGDGSRLRAVLALPRLDVFRLHTYVVRTRGHVVADVDFFAARAAETYADPRGWRRAHHRFARVRRGGDFTLVLAQARFLPTYSSVCSTAYSCRVGRNVVINQTRWRHGSPPFPGDLATYRAMVLNHETGHWLGRPHAFCSGAGRPAPVMQQQSKGMQGCRPNAWPLAREIRAVS